MSSNAEPSDTTPSLAISQWPVVAAFQVGRLLRRWRFFAAQQWLGVVEAGPECENALAQLTRTVRALVAPVQRDRIEETVRDWRQRCRLHLESAAHCLGLEESNRWLAEERRYGEDLEFSARWEIEKLLGPLEGFMTELRNEVISRLDNAGIAAMSLGEWLEQGACPSDVGYHLSGPSKASSDSANNAQTQNRPSPWGLPSDRKPIYRVAERFVRAGEFAPPDEWLNGIRQRWEELRAALGPIPVSLDLPAEASDIATIESAMAITETALRRYSLEAQDALADNERPPSEQPPSYLGLTLDPDRFSVGRSGQTDAVEFGDSRLVWEILQLLMRRRSRYTSRDVLRELWPKFGRKSDPDDATIDNAISALRRRLRCLEVNVSGSRGVGWRLESADSPEAD